METTITITLAKFEELRKKANQQPEVMYAVYDTRHQQVAGVFFDQHEAYDTANKHRTGMYDLARFSIITVGVDCLKLRSY